MSKAFVKDDAADPDDAETPETAAALPPGGKNYITPEGFARLQAEKKQLLEVDRPEVVKTVAWAASLGDRSENADYIYGKRRLREIDRRVRFLIKRLEAAQIVHSSGRDTDQVFFGARVRVRGASGERTIRIVGIDEVDPAKGCVSWISPIARALIKAREGELVRLRTPAGEETLEILEVDYP
jgi:transcription elongation factor GreB